MEEIEKIEDLDKDGFLFKRFGSKMKRSRIGSKWNQYYFNLMGSSLHYYAEEDDEKPKGTVDLRDSKLTRDDNEGSSKKYCFTLKSEKFDFLFAAESEEDYIQWCNIIEKNISKEPKGPLAKDKKRNRMQQMAFRAKRNLAGKVGSSGVGKKAIKAQAPEEISNLITALKKIIERESKSPKKAAEIEDTIFKIGIKTYFIIDEGKLKLDDIFAADEPLRKALELLSKCHDHAKFSRSPNPKLLFQKLQEVEKLVKEAETALIKILEPLMKPKNTQRIRDAIDYIANAEFLAKIFNDSALDEPLQELINAGDHYTQFHFYAEK